jgi:hypothetical protein
VEERGESIILKIGVEITANSEMRSGTRKYIHVFVDIHTCMWSDSL